MMSDFADDFSDLDTLNNEFKPENPFDPPFEDLGDGAYNFEVAYAELTKSANNVRIFNLGIKVDGGNTFKHTYWLNSQQEVNKLGQSLAVLGFEAHKWGSGAGKIPLSTALPDAARRLPGIKFRGTKTSQKGKKGDKVFHHLNVNCRVIVDAKPAAPAAVPAAKTNESQGW